MSPGDLMAGSWFGALRRGVKKPPHYIARRLVREAYGQAERRLAPRRAEQLTPAVIARRCGYGSVEHWWSALSVRPYAAVTRIAAEELERVCPGEVGRVVAAADRSASHRVNLLGSGEISLGADIDWLKDYKSGYRWPVQYYRDIDYNNRGRPSDVKFPWELSRLQWTLPLGQAYVLTGDERYAASAAELLDSWMGANPYAHTVNWSCTMEVALRIVSLSWLFHAFKDSDSWAGEGFRDRFLRCLYLHADFTERNIEESDVNGNHYLADAAGLVFAGLFFGEGEAPQRWLRKGWKGLCDEMPRQVFADGVDFEASVSYHRLVQELFLLPALYRERHALDTPPSYRMTLQAMARFTVAYSRSDGTVPLWGDADDGRVLPLGGQPLNDHRYLIGVNALFTDATDLLQAFSGPRSEIAWLLGPGRAASLDEQRAHPPLRVSTAFRDGGYYVLQGQNDHVFVDCGPVGLKGRGGHGHNDLMSFEAYLDGVLLISDCGAYVYTADYDERDRFRSTAYHNTPQVDGEEINRFLGADTLWSLRDDAAHELHELSFGAGVDRVVVSHSGYTRLRSPVTPRRSFELDTRSHRLSITDEFHGSGHHRLEIRAHLAPTVHAFVESPGRVALVAHGREFNLLWEPTSDWELRIEPARTSPSYGVAIPSKVLVWSRDGALVPLRLTVTPR
jgi:uncharacterized heparinase superfamily protein